jgi:hypothetical protein
MEAHGPKTLNPDGLIPLAPFARPMGFHLPVFTSPATWKTIVRHGPYAALSALGTAVENALSAVGSVRADRASIDFKWWAPNEGAEQKAKKVRLRATLYQTEDRNIWILLAPAPERFRPGVSRAS